MDKTGTAQKTRNPQDSALTLTPTQIGLAVGVVSVCCLMTFGGGVIAGMWYKASEQSSLYTTTLADLPAEATTTEHAAAAPLADARVTFYDTLKWKTPYAPLAAAVGNPGTAKILTRPESQPALSTKNALESVASSSPADMPKTSLPAAPAVSSGSPSAAAAPYNSPPASPEQHKSTVAPGGLSNQSQTKTAAAAPASGNPPLLKPALPPAAATKTTTRNVKPVVATAPAPGSTSAPKPALPPSGTPVASTAAKDTAAALAGRGAATAAGTRENRSDTDSSGRRQAEAPPAAPAARAGDGQYSVQAGSFRSPAQAERLRNQLAQKGYQTRVQLFTAPNNESWYRVRVGNYNDRSAAGQTAHNLTSREQIQTVVANDQQ